jgi:hypothetical protein
VEDNKRGERFRERILDETASSGRFRRAIGCVWYRDDVPSEIKQVVEANRSEPRLRPEAKPQEQPLGNAIDAL